MGGTPPYVCAIPRIAGTGKFGTTTATEVDTPYERRTIKGLRSSIDGRMCTRRNTTMPEEATVATTLTATLILEIRNDTKANVIQTLSNCLDQIAAGTYKWGDGGSVKSPGTWVRSVERRGVR